MFSVITNIYNKKTKGPSLMELFIATEKLKVFFWQLEIFDVCRVNLLPHTRLRVWQKLDYRMDVCRVILGAHIENL